MVTRSHPALLTRAVLALITGASLACSDSPAAPVIVEEPAPEPERAVFTDLSAGGEHTCAIRSDGILFCWGSARNGRLGEGTLQPGISTRPVAPLPAVPFHEIAAGYGHSCAIAGGGSVYCWGIASNGQVGNRSSDTEAEPFLVDEHPHTFLDVTVGERHSCALDLNQLAFCWGWNHHGQIGNASTIDQGVPVSVHASERFLQIDAGDLHTCAVTFEGRTFCWGRNHEGQVGNGARTEAQTSPAAVSGDLRFSAVSAGGAHSCGLTRDGSAYCWGAGGGGQLGTGERESSTVPVPVEGDLRFVRISAGAEHTCAVTQPGQVYCWGHSSYGRLGFESLPAAVLSPAPVESDVVFTNVSAGRLHTCAIADEGAVYCWGHGGFGQLGNGTLFAHPVPTRVLEPAGPPLTGAPTQ